MAIDTVTKWAEWHANLFGFAQSFAPTVSAWVNEFIATGYSPDELVSATRAVSALPAEKAPKYPGDHYAMLVRALQAERQRIRQKDASAETRRIASGDDRGVCELCSNTKWVIVPHLKYLEEWSDAARFVTFGVACRCFLGRTMVSNWDVKRPKTMTLEEYERQLPSWREYVAQEREIRMKRVATANVMALKTDLRQTLAGLASKFAMPKV